LPVPPDAGKFQADFHGIRIAPPESAIDSATVAGSAISRPFGWTTARVGLPPERALETPPELAVAGIVDPPPPTSLPPPDRLAAMPPRPLELMI
jgi:hypothetical protein